MKNKFEYVMQVFKQAYGISVDMPLVTYGTEPAGSVFIREGRTSKITEKKAVNINLEDVVWQEWKNMRIPFFFSKGNDNILEEKEGRWIINMDIIASAFYLLSGWQEFFSEKKDRYGRFRYEDSCQHLLGITSIPVVNYYFDILKTAIEKCQGKPIPARSWGGHPLAACLTHDIDTCESAWLQGSFHALKRRDVITPLKLLFKKMAGKDAWFNFNEILDIESGYNARSTFFFLPRHKARSGIKNADYKVTHRKFSAVYARIRNKGSEVGVHGSIGSNIDSRLLNEDMSRVGEGIKGNRFHFLLYDARITPEVLERCKLRFDSSLGFAEAYGFRNSFCLPFKPYDINNDRAFDYYEIPLVLMDGTLQKYMKKSASDCLSGVEDLLKEIRKFGGCFTLLWHNTHFSEFKYPGWRKVYTDILDLCKKEGALFESCSNILKQY
ncbi:MAG: polysaccharide deacetylase family protein [Bacteroidota bacterium]